MSAIPEFASKTLVLGEAIYVIDDDLQLVLKARVTKISKDEDLGVTTTIEVANEIVYNSVCKTISR